MVAVDSSSLIALFQDESGPDLDKLQRALMSGGIVLPPVVLVEVLSGAELTESQRQSMTELPQLEIMPDYWVRAAATRATVLRRGLRARLADTLIAQSCIDYDVPLITRDADFRHFAKHCGLKLA